MIPYRDLNPTRRAPVATTLLIAANIAAFVWQLGARDSGLRFAAVPYQILHPWAWDSIFTPVTAITSAFLHGGLAHLAGNMLFLWVFGDNVEDRLGRGAFVRFYLVAALVACLAHAVVQPGSRIPMVGASGAVAAVLGAYLHLFPSARIKGFFLIVIYPVFFIWRAKIFIGLWLALQIFGSLMSDPDAPGVAWWAHIGGFAYGWWAVSTGRVRKR